MPAILNHVSLTVSNLERTIEFYQKCFGFHVARRGDYSGPLVEALMSFKDASIAVAFLRTGSIALELIEFRSPKGKGTKPPPMNEAGSPHLGLLTKDARADYQRLSAMGVRFDSEPVVNYRTGTYTVMLRDPDGIPIELIERPAVE
ncbi:MAG: VOC family protein [Chloroflexi bacterium]|nr:VOC family protein [Chloroflexota bacterium]